jgi:hypothetical protein
MANINLTVGGLDISSGGGENDFCSTTEPQTMDTKTGVNGDGVAYDTPNSWVEVTITTLEPFGINQSLQALYTAQRSDGNQGGYDFQLEDIGTTEELAGIAFFVKGPDRNKGAEAVNYEWMLHVFAPDGWVYRSRGVVV